MRRNLFFASLFLMLSFVFTALPVSAKPSEYDLLVRHFRTKYGAKKVNIPFVWFARFAVSVVRPAGVKSFSVTLFQDLKFSAESVDKEMQSTLRNSFGEGWSPIFRARSAEGQQAYMYMREQGNLVRLALVTIDKQNAAIIRATFSPERLADFINDPKVFGISLNDNDPAKKNDANVNVTVDVDKDKDKDKDQDKDK